MAPCIGGGAFGELSADKVLEEVERASGITDDMPLRKPATNPRAEPAPRRHAVGRHRHHEAKPRRAIISKLGRLKELPYGVDAQPEASSCPAAIEVVIDHLL